MTADQIERLIGAIRGKADLDPLNPKIFEDWFAAVRLLGDDPGRRFSAYQELPELRRRAQYLIKNSADSQALQRVYHLIGQTWLYAAQDDFDSYCIYLEWRRPPDKKFYQPRRRVLRVLAQDLQDLADRKIVFLGVSLPPRVGKSTLCIFFITWLMGKYPDSASVMSGHSDKLTDGFYGEVLNIITDVDTYNWNEIFPGVKLVDKSAKNETVDLNRKKRFPTLTCRSIGGTLTGAVEIGENGVLYSDDLIEDLEESLNPVRLDAKYDAYLNQLKDRKKLGALELMVGTRWNVLDPLGRISEQYRDDPKYRFRVIPALDENDHSNFNYDYGVGFDDAYYHDMRASIDHATWLAKYQGNPVVREGLLFPRDELKWYNGVLPDGEPDRKLMVADIAWGGGDFFSAPVAYVYGASVYIQDVVFSNADKTVTKPAVCAKIKAHMPHTFRGEANNGGDEYCDSIDGMLRSEGVHLSIRSQRAPNTQSKLSRILQYAPDIKQFYFVDDAHSSPEYRAFMGQVTTFTSTGKNPHDDAPDSLAMLAEELNGSLARVTVINRPF